MNNLFRMTLKETCASTPYVPEGLTIQVACNNWDGSASREDICRALHCMGFTGVRENDAVCCFAVWKREKI